MEPFPASAFQKPKLNNQEFEQAPGEAEGQGSLARCSPWGHKESDTTEWLNNKTLQELRRGCQTNKPRIRKQNRVLGRSWRPAFGKAMCAWRDPAGENHGHLYRRHELPGTSCRHCLGLRVLPAAISGTPPALHAETHSDPESLLSPPDAVPEKTHSRDSLKMS